MGWNQLIELGLAVQTNGATSQAYVNNPNFLNMVDDLSVKFEPHDEFKKKDLIARTALYQKICERIYE